MSQGSYMDKSGSESRGVRPELGAGLEEAEKRTEDKKRKPIKCRLHFLSVFPLH